ncbi:unnamed protein product [Trichogramma brassicae]|uniref:Uncharacterized protein n=1 Tax=Trichogramma brassicae TaxID=86971 RepID=A0A6H5HT04_9HYME|nr:unnamed protein product [Trichogramma brassicae]
MVLAWISVDDGESYIHGRTQWRSGDGPGTIFAKLNEERSMHAMRHCASFCITVVGGEGINREWSATQRGAPRSFAAVAGEQADGLHTVSPAGPIDEQSGGVELLRTQRVGKSQPKRVAEHARICSLWSSGTCAPSSGAGGTGGSYRFPGELIPFWRGLDARIGGRDGLEESVQARQLQLATAGAGNTNNHENGTADRRKLLPVASTKASGVGTLPSYPSPGEDVAQRRRIAAVGVENTVNAGSSWWRLSNRGRMWTPDRSWTDLQPKRTYVTDEALLSRPEQAAQPGQANIEPVRRTREACSLVGIVRKRLEKKVRVERKGCDDGHPRREENERGQSHHSRGRVTGKRIMVSTVSCYVSLRLSVPAINELPDGIPDPIDGGLIPLRPKRDD